MSARVLLLADVTILTSVTRLLPPRGPRGGVITVPAWTHHAQLASRCRTVSQPRRVRTRPGSCPIHTRTTAPGMGSGQWASLSSKCKLGPGEDRRLRTSSGFSKRMQSAQKPIRSPDRGPGPSWVLGPGHEPGRDEPGLTDLSAWNQSRSAAGTRVFFPNPGQGEGKQRNETGKRAESPAVPRDSQVRRAWPCLRTAPGRGYPGHGRLEASDPTSARTGAQTPSGRRTGGPGEASSFREARSRQRLGDR